LILLEKISGSGKTEVVIVSGQDKTFAAFGSGISILILLQEHGVLIKEKEKTAATKAGEEELDKKNCSHYATVCEKLPGASVEEKEFSLVFHYSQS